jgi:hypothetical protein
MQKWEYKTEILKATGDAQQYLETQGNSGWELCVFNDVPAQQKGNVLIIFKRPKQ